MRRPVAWVVAVVLFVEAFFLAALNWFLGEVVHRQKMSLAGLDPDVMSTSSKAGGVVFGSTSPCAAWSPCSSPCGTAARPGSAASC